MKRFKKMLVFILVALILASSSQVVLQASSANPAAHVSGPSLLTASDLYGEYTFYMTALPEYTRYIKMTFQIEDAYFSAEYLASMNDWGILSEDPWVQNGNFWNKTIILTRGGSASAGDWDFLKLTVKKKSMSGQTEISIINVEAATPASVFKPVIEDSAVTDFIVFSRYDVNTDGHVDGADIATAAHFHRHKRGDPDWETKIQFGPVWIAPCQADVNDDGVIDIEYLILILANFD